MFTASPQFVRWIELDREKGSGFKWDTNIEDAPGVIPYKRIYDFFV
jgi:hypothetical protein